MYLGSNAQAAVAHAVSADDPLGQTRRLIRVAPTQQERVPARLHLLGVVLWQQHAHGPAELGGRVGSVLVPVRLGQSGVARQVGEDEGVGA
jgi:hypothetical protein